MPATAHTRAAAEATLHLPFSIPAKEWFTPAEAARLLGLSERFIEKLYDDGYQLAGHSHNGGAGLRMTKKIPRVWIVTYAVKTATYDDASLTDALIACLPGLSPHTLLRLAEAARKAAVR